ncbi:hypothetical protein [[Mycobacterium] nativiensis]|uniref:UsfY protein n=1 Tax=[Mycobacterium] nativiensis TaxID=2855503 RepID=A0ABU5Y2G1_9MYCO|nr:hypothetical protein [Mycolicibacter sp. MYC340]MEB3033401.1 hypothetical protein [Mycolicibacter sp. MYC340]
MADDTPAKVWSDQKDLPINLGDAGDGFRLPFKEKWRFPDALAALIGFCTTAALLTFNLENGNVLPILAFGVIGTVIAVWALGKLPAVRPSIRTRIQWWLADARPQVSCSHRTETTEGARAQ